MADREKKRGRRIYKKSISRERNETQALRTFVGISVS